MTNQLDTNVSYLKFNEETFKKTSKRLTSLLRDSEKYPVKIPLNVMQETLAQSLGFRNTDSIINYFKKKEEALPPTKNDNKFIFNWSQNNPGNPEFLVNLILSLVEDEHDSAWKKRAVPLISAVMGALMHMSDNGEILLNSELIGEYLILDTVIKTYKTRRDFPSHIREALRAYILSIPNFQEGATKQNDTVLEQHGFLQMQFQPALHALKKLEKCDPLIVNPEWFQAVYRKEYTSKKDLENPYKPITFTERLTKHNLNNLYTMFPSCSLIGNYTDNENISFMLDYGIRFEKSEDETIKFFGFQLINPIANSIYAEDSWLSDPFFMQILLGMFKGQQMKPLYLTDLIMYSFKIVNQKKRALYLNCVHNLLKNYETVVEYSKEIHDLAH